jgi:hypothetical protein
MLPHAVKARSLLEPTQTRTVVLGVIGTNVAIAGLAVALSRVL